MIKGKRYKFKKKEILLKFLLVLFIIILCIIMFFIYNKYKNKTEYEHLSNILHDIPNDDTSTIKDNEETEKMKKLKELQMENPDIIAWLEIENSNINYPVLQSKENNEFYMTHNYKKEYSIDGSLFLDEKYDFNLPSTNFLIYGHNNRGSNEMFAGLMNYKDENYYQTHKIIKLTTTKEDSEYQIISVFLGRVYYKSEKNVFRYYYFINANNEEEFNNYIENSKKASLYNIEESAVYGDELLTLSTCEYSQQNGRFAIVAKKIKK